MKEGGIRRRSQHPQLEIKEEQVLGAEGEGRRGGRLPLWWLWAKQEKSLYDLYGEGRTGK